MPAASAVLDLPDTPPIAEQPPRRAATAGRLAALLARPDLVALGFVLLFALLIRLLWLETVPPNVTADEADTALFVTKVVTGHGTGFFGLDWTQLPAFNAYVLAAVMRVAGNGIFGLRIASAVLSTVALIPFFFLARRVAGPLAALLAALLLACNAWYLNFSRSGWENVWICAYLLAALLFVELGLDRGRLRYFALAGIACALGLYGYYAGRTILPILLAYLPFALWQRRQAPRFVLRGYALLIVVAVGLFLPQLVTMLGQWDVAMRRTSAVWVLGNAPSASAGILLALQQLAITLRAFVLLDPGLLYNLRYNQDGAAVLDPITGVAYVVGLVMAARRWRETMPWWLALGIGLLPLQVLAEGAPDGARAVAFAPIVYLFVALMLGETLVRPALLPIRLALVALVPLTLHMTVTDYFAWMRSSQLADARQPAVEAADFPAWQAAQMVELQAGRIGFNVLEWQKLHPTAVKEPKATPGPARAAEPPLVGVGEGQDGPRLGTVTATLGLARDVERLNQPYAVASDSYGNVYIADTGNARVLKLDPQGKRLLVIGRRGEGEGQFLEPFDLAVDKQDRLYVLDSERSVIQRFAPDGTFADTLLGDADMYHPRGLTLDASGILYVAGTGRNRILQVSPDGQILKTWEKTEDRTLEQPAAVAVDKNGSLYVSEPELRRIEVLDQTGRPLARRELPPGNTRDAPHLAITAKGQVVMSDPSEGRVALLDSKLSWRATLDTKGFELEMPVGVAVTRDGQIWIADPARGQVVRVNPGK